MKIVLVARRLRRSLAGQRVFDDFVVDGWKVGKELAGVGFVGHFDVEPNEAELLTGLIETLVDDTYIASHKRRQQLEAIINLGKAKTRDKK